MIQEKQDLSPSPTPSGDNVDITLHRDPLDFGNLRWNEELGSGTESLKSLFFARMLRPTRWREPTRPLMPIRASSALTTGLCWAVQSYSVSSRRVETLRSRVHGSRRNLNLPLAARLPLEAPRPAATGIVGDGSCRKAHRTREGALRSAAAAAVGDRQ